MLVPRFFPPKNASEAISVQIRLAKRITFAKLRKVRLIAAGDVAFRDGGKTALAACVLMNDRLELLERHTASTDVRFPYVPGLLAFREIPAILTALKKLSVSPDLLLCDGHGYAHPRRFGLACHLGVILQMPSIGCAKSRLCGRHKDPGPKKGDYEYVYDKNEKIGTYLRTKENVNPVYISVGNMVTLDCAVKFTLKLVSKYRLPEPLRIADKLSKQFRPLPRKSC